MSLAPDVPYNVGDSAFGGYVVGVVDTTKGNIIAADASQTGQRYVLILSPKSLQSSQYYLNSGSTPAGARTRWDGLSATAALVAASGGPGPAAAYCAGLARPSDAGSAWYLPAMDELELVYRNLKPTTDVNSTASQNGASGTFPYSAVSYLPGVNPSSDPTGPAYTGGNPAQTSLTAFRYNGAQTVGIDATNQARTWSSTAYSTFNAWYQNMAGASSTAGQQSNSSNASYYVRPVRRVLVSDLNKPPNAPTLTTPVDGSTIDLSVTQRLAWAFSDPDPGDSQSKFDLHYRVVGGPTWTDVTGTTPNQFWDAPPATFTAADYEWQARTYDSQGVVGPYSASGFFTTATAPAAPTITAPVSGGTVAVTDTLAWSTPNQARYQVRRVADDAGAPDTATVYWDSGEVTDGISRSRSVAFPINNRWEWTQVRVRYGGLWSAWASVRVQVSWTPPAAATGVKTPVPADAAIDLTITNPAPSGGEPTVSYNNIYYAEPGEAEERKATLVPPNSTWRHWLPASDAVYTYRIEAVGSNGTTSETTVS